MTVSRVPLKKACVNSTDLHRLWGLREVFVVRRVEGRRQRDFIGRTHKNSLEICMRDQSVRFSHLENSWTSLELQRLDYLRFF